MKSFSMSFWCNQAIPIHKRRHPMPDRLPPVKAIRAYCRERCCLSAREVRLCAEKDCFLYEYRLGRNSARAGIGGSRRNPEGRFLSLSIHSSGDFPGTGDSKRVREGKVLGFLPRANKELLIMRDGRYFSTGKLAPKEARMRRAERRRQIRESKVNGRETLSSVSM